MHKMRRHLTTYLTPVAFSDGQSGAFVSLPLTETRAYPAYWYSFQNGF